MRLSQERRKQRDSLVLELNSAAEEVTDAMEEFNKAASAAVQEAREKLKAAKAKHWPEVQKAVAAYNEKVQTAKSFLEGCGVEIDEYTAEKSDKWHESDKGQAIGSMREEYETDLDEVSIDEPNEAELQEPDALEPPDDMNAGEILDNLPVDTNE